MTDEYRRAREKMVGEQLIPRKIKDPRVLAAMRTTPRHFFVDESLVHQAYGDYPLPIGHGQTISQPFIVALMTEALELTGLEKCLEIGTGSGYQTVILAELAGEVYTVERIKPLLEQARMTIEQLGYTNVHSKAFDGTLGWPEHQPYDAIIVTAGGPVIPQPLQDQLAEGGRLIIPVGSQISQDLIKLTKRQGSLIRENLGGCHFVNLIGIHGWKD